MPHSRSHKIPITGRFLNVKKILVVGGLAATLVATVYAAEPIAIPTRPLTEAESVQLALARPALQSLDEARLALARSDVAAAGRWSNPQFQYSREEVDRAGGDMTDEFFWLSQRLEISGQRGLRKRAAEQRVGAAGLATDAERIAIETDARTRFYQALHQQARARAIVDWIARMTATEAIIRKRQAAGEVSGYDAVRLSTERVSAQASLRQARARFARLWAELSAVLGGERVVAPYDGVAGRLLPEAPAPLADLLASLNARPDIARLESEAAAHELDRRADARSWVPELTLGVGHKLIDDDLGRDSGPMVSAGISIPLFDRGQPEQQRAAANTAIARSEFELALATAEGEVRGRWLELNELIATAHSQQEEARVDAKRLVEIAEAAYRGGELGVLELLDAYRGAHEAELLALRIATLARHARIELDRLTGGPEL